MAPPRLDLNAAYASAPEAAFDDPDPPLTARIDKASGRKVLTPRTFLLLVGTLIVLLISIIPLWDAMRLLDDPTFVFFLGRTWPTWMIIVCLSAIVGYVVIILGFFRYARPEYKSEQTVMMIGIVVCTALGLSLLCISQPLASESLAAYTDLFFNCAYGARTQRLFEYATVLQLIRMTPECASKASIEECSGFQESQPYTGFMRNLEARYRCTGFCPDPAVQLDILGAINASSAGNAGTASSASSIVGAAMLQSSAAAGHPGKLAGALQRLAEEHRHRRRPQQQQGGRAFAFLQVDSVAEHRAADVVATAGPVHQPGKVGSYPPTLFSKANYQVSCEGMAARALKYEALDVARVLYIEGLALLLTSVGISLVKVAGMCFEGNIRAYLFGTGNGDANKPRQPKEVIM